MTPISDVVLLLSLGANGTWLGNGIVCRLREKPARLVQVTLGLLGLTILLIVGVFVLHHGILFTLDKSLSFVAMMACMQCCLPLMELAPRPWGNAPKKRKAP